MSRYSIKILDQKVGYIDCEDSFISKDNWVGVSEQKPQSGKKVIGYYINNCGKGRTIITKYIAPRTVKVEDFFSEDWDGDDCAEYDEEKDCYWVTEGWWEDSEESEMNWHISYEMSHWMHLPKPPLLESKHE